MGFESNSRQDVYQYSDADTQAGRNPAGPGPNPNLQREAVCPQPGPGSAPGGRVSPCDWRPDPTYSTPQAQQWRQQFEQLRPQPLQINQDGTYTVVPGDCPSGIAERVLHMRGQAATSQAINAEVQKIVAMNKDQYPTLDCNNARIQDGWNLRVDVQGPAPAPPQAPPEVQPQTPPRSHHRCPCPDDRDQSQGDIPQPVPLQMGVVGDQRQPVAPVYQGDVGNQTYVNPGAAYVEPARRYSPDLGTAQPPLVGIDIQQRYYATPDYLQDPGYHSHRRREFILRSHDDDYKHRFGDDDDRRPRFGDNDDRRRRVAPLVPPVAGTQFAPPYREALPVVPMQNNQRPRIILDDHGNQLTPTQGQPRVRETNVPTAQQLERQRYLQEQLARQDANRDRTIPRTGPAAQAPQADLRRYSQTAGPGEAIPSTDMPPLPPRPVQRPAAPPSAQPNGEQQWRAQYGKVAPAFKPTNDGTEFQNQIDPTQMKDPNRNGNATIDKKWVAPKVNLDGPIVQQTEDGTGYKFQKM